MKWCMHCINICFSLWLYKYFVCRTYLSVVASFQCSKQAESGRMNSDSTGIVTPTHELYQQHHHHRHQYIQETLTIPIKSKLCLITLQLMQKIYVMIIIIIITLICTMREHVIFRGLDPRVW